MDVEPFPSYRSESEIEKPADLSRWSAGALNTNQRAVTFETRSGFYHRVCCRTTNEKALDGVRSSCGLTLTGEGLFVRGKLY